MRWRSLLFTFTVVSANTYGQLSMSDSKIAESVRAKYYNLEARGFQSVRCSMKFDLSTVPSLPQTSNDPVRKLIEATAFTLTIDSKGRPNIQHLYPSDTGDDTIKQAAQVTNLLSSLVGGLFQTWSSKGLNGPIPAFNNQIESIATTDKGFTFNLHVPGAPIQVFVDKDFLVKEIVSAGGKLHEQPEYEPTSEGLVFTGNSAIDRNSPDNPVAVKSHRYKA